MVAALLAVAAAGLAIFTLAGRAGEPVAVVTPVVATAQVTDDPDDPAIWVNRSDPARSLIFGTNKVKAPTGRWWRSASTAPSARCSPASIARTTWTSSTGLRVGGELVDIVVVTERLKNQLRVFRIAPDGSGFAEISSPGRVGVFKDRSGEEAAPMGIGLYRRAARRRRLRDPQPQGRAARRATPGVRLDDDGAGRVQATWVRTFGQFSGVSEIEAIAVDDDLGYVYYADEGDGIHKYHADPDRPDAARELAHFGLTGFNADREGIAIYARDDKTGYIVCTDQLDRSSEFHVYRREGAPATRTTTRSC